MKFQWEPEQWSDVYKRQAPFYSDKYAKIGFQVSELFDDELLKEKVVRVAEQKNVLLEHLYHCLLYTSRCV